MHKRCVLILGLLVLGLSAGPAAHSAPTKPPPKPDLSVRFEAKDDKGAIVSNGATITKKGTVVTFHAFVKNVGKGATPKGVKLKCQLRLYYGTLNPPGARVISELAAGQEVEIPNPHVATLDKKGNVTATIAVDTDNLVPAGPTGPETLKMQLTAKF